MRSDDDRETEGSEDVYHFTTDTSRAAAVIEAIAYVRGVDPLEIQPLAEVIDPDALNALFDQTEHGTVSFEFEHLLVDVHATGDLVIRENH